MCPGFWDGPTVIPFAKPLQSIQSEYAGFFVRLCPQIVGIQDLSSDTSPTKGVTWAVVSVPEVKRNVSICDLRAPVVPVDFIDSKLILKMFARDARAIIRRPSVCEPPSRNSKMLAYLAILRDEL
jgi:hypothetical protein